MNEPESNTIVIRIRRARRSHLQRRHRLNRPPRRWSRPHQVRPELDGAQADAQQSAGGHALVADAGVATVALAGYRSYVLIVALGLAQRFGWITSASHSGQPQTTAAADKSTRYICPMMCTPPQSEPGRCPVCAMELVPATSGGGDTDSQSIQIDPAARRVANIQTVPVKQTSASRTIRVIGELSYDEGHFENAFSLRRRPHRELIRRLYRRRGSKGRPTGVGLLASFVFQSSGTVVGQEITRYQSLVNSQESRRIESRLV